MKTILFKPRTYFEVLLLLWQLPQALAGLLCLLYYRLKHGSLCRVYSPYLYAESVNLDQFFYRDGDSYSLPSLSTIRPFQWIVALPRDLVSPFSLGPFVFLEYLKGSPSSSDRDLFSRTFFFTFLHELFGHGRQSRLLGPLYLFVIGLPSALWNLFQGRESQSVWLPVSNNCTARLPRFFYYWFYTESWANVWSSFGSFSCRVWFSSALFDDRFLEFPISLVHSSGSSSVSSFGSVIPSAPYYSNTLVSSARPLPYRTARATNRWFWKQHPSQLS